MILFSIHSFSQSFEWVEFNPLVDMNSNGGSGGISVTRDNQGNLYNVCYFTSPIIAGDDTLNHEGNLNRPDILITKWSDEGEFLAYRRIRNFSNNGNPDPRQLQFDAVHDELVMSINSYYDGTQVTLQASPESGDMSDSTMYLLRGSIWRFTADLMFVSMTGIDGGGSYTTPFAIEGEFCYASQGYFNGLISKLDHAGDVVWSNSAESGNFSITELQTNSDGELFAIGFLHNNGSGSGPVTFGGISFSAPLPGYNSQAFLFKLDTLGNVLNGRYLCEFSTSLGIATDSNGNVYVIAGYGTPGQMIDGVSLEPLSGGTDGFVAKFNTDLELDWLTHCHHTGTNMQLNDIVAAESGTITMIGRYGANSSPGGFSLPTSSYGSGFLIQFDPSTGSIEYATQLGALSAGTGSANAMVNDGSKYYITGLSYGSGNGPGVCSYGCYTETRTACFLTLFNSNEFSNGPIELTYGGASLSATGFHPDASLQWYFNGEPLDGETSSSVIPDANGTYSITATVFGCESSENIILCVPNQSTDVINSCEPIVWIDGQTYSESNSTATMQLTNVAGCDSIVTLNLTITQFEALVTINNDQLIAQPADAEYQWYDCSSKLNEIEGEQSQTYSPQQSGLYSVMVIINGCGDYSDCVTFTDIKVENSHSDSEVNLFPNPCEDQMFIQSGSPIESYTIYDNLGRYIGSFQPGSIKMLSVPTQNLPSGLYLISVVTANGTDNQRFVVEH